jgi:hypothetical protein
MRAFVQGKGQDRKFVCIEVSGRRMTVISGKADGSQKRQEKVLASEAEASAAVDRMAQEMLSRGYVERSSLLPAALKAAPAPAAPVPAPKVRPPEPEEDDANYALVEVLDEAPEAPAPAPQGMATPPAGGQARGGVQTRKKSKKKKKRKKEPGEKTDWVTIGGASAAGVLLVGLVGWLAWSTFLKPASIIGTWAGSRVEKDLGGPIIYSRYRLALTEGGRARMVLQDEIEQLGTYRVQGDRLKLNFVDEEGDSDAIEYKIQLSSVTLTLLEPETGKTVVELIRQREMDSVPGAGGQGSPKGGDKLPAGADPPLDPTLVTEDFRSKDGAFACRYPVDWEPESGSRPDNTYSWAEFTRGSNTLRIDADVTGSLVADIEKSFGGGGEGDESPVASVHQMNERKVAEGFTDYEEGPSRSLTNPSLGEGRIAEFTAESSGLFSTKLHGYRATLLGQNRRITILCSAPEKQWEKLKPTFFAFIQGVKR